MEINSKVFFNIFKENFDYEIVDTPLGMAIKMPAYNAYVYSVVTGSGYLESPMYPYTPKGLTKLFYSAFDFKFVTGIFDNLSLKYTPLLLSKAKPYIFEGDKFILPKEFNKDVELTEELESMYELVPNPHDYLIQRIECRKKGNGMEPFLEYLAAEHFKSKSYIVETQIPLAHSTGSPDFGGYNLAEPIKQILCETYLNNGFHMIELAMIRQSGRLKNKPTEEATQDSESKAIVGEAKTSTSIMDAQLDKYLDFGVFDEGYEITAMKSEPKTGKYGLITIDGNFGIKEIEPTLKRTIDMLANKHNYIEWLQNYIKFYLMANLTNDEFDSYYQEMNKSPIQTQEEITQFICSLSIAQIFNRIRKLDGSI